MRRSRRGSCARWPNCKPRCRCSQALACHSPHGARGLLRDNADAATYGAIGTGDQTGQPRAGTLPRHHAVVIEPGLRRQSTTNGNFPGRGGRLSATSPLGARNRERRDRPLNCESPSLAGLSALMRQIFRDAGTAWLRQRTSIWRV
jgi:hypothetical protein